MELLRLSLQARLRRGWVASLVIVLLVGVVGGFVIAAASAARRVDGAYRALVSEIDAPDLLMFPACGSDAGAITGCAGPPSVADTSVVTEELGRVRGVERVRPLAGLRPYLTAPDGTPLLAEAGNPTGCSDGDRSVGLVALRDGGPREQSLPFRLVGDMPDGMQGEIVLTRATAERVGVGIGDGLTVAGWCTGDGDPVELSEPIDLVVSGLSIGAFDVEPPGTGQAIESVYVEQSVLDALYDADAERFAYNAVWLADDSTSAVTRELDGYDVLLDLAEQTAIIDDALDAEARPLWILAAAGALAGILLLAPIIDRSIRSDTDDVATLVALGGTKPQIGRLAASHVVVLAAAGTLVAVVSAPLTAAVLPDGLAGAIVTDGVWFDVIVTAAGVMLLFSAVAGIAAVSTWRLVVGHHTSRPVTGLTTDRAVSSLRLRPPAQTGVMAAVGRPAGGWLPSPWPGLVSLVLVSTACVAGLTYVSGLRNLEQSPELLGWNWDAVVSFDELVGTAAPGVLSEIERVDGVESATKGTRWPPAFLSMPDSDLQVWPWSFDTGAGSVTPTIVEGRAPDGPDEIAIDLGFRDLTGLEPGDTVQLERPSLADQIADQLQHSFDVPSPGHEPVVATFEITGIAVLSNQRTQLIPQTSHTLAGLVAFATPSAEEVEAARAWLPDDVPADVREEVDAWLADPGNFDIVVYVRTSGDDADAVARLGDLDGVERVAAPGPLEVMTLINALNLSTTDNVPLALAILSAVAALALVTYLLATSMWARRTELAMLRALGLSSWGVRSTLAAQATFTVMLVLAVSIPIGVAIGQWAWLGYARDLLVVPEGAFPWQGLVALVVGALVVANAVALVIARVSVNRSASQELRAE